MAFRMIRSPRSRRRLREDRIEDAPTPQAAIRTGRASRPGRSRAQPTIRPASAVRWAAAIGLAILGPTGCSGTNSSERSGEEMRRRLPAELSRLLPADAVLCHHETAESPGKYELWIFRHPHGAYLDLPVPAPGGGRSRRGVRRHTHEGGKPGRHELPASVLKRVLAAKAPWLEPGQPQPDVCRFTHWESGEAEYRVREIVTDRGWFASVEEFRQ